MNHDHFVINLAQASPWTLYTISPVSRQYIWRLLYFLLEVSIQKKYEASSIEPGRCYLLTCGTRAIEPMDALYKFEGSASTYMKALVLLT